jgi:hypothetical protein
MDNLVMVEDAFTITIAGTDQHDTEELEEAARQLRDELSEVDEIELAGVPGDPAPEGTRGALVDLVLAFVVTYYGGKVAFGGGRDLMRLERRLRTSVLPHMARVIHDWSRRNKDKQAIIKRPDGTEYHLTNLSEDEIASVLAGTREQAPRKKNG